MMFSEYYPRLPEGIKNRYDPENIIFNKWFPITLA